MNMKNLILIFSCSMFLFSCQKNVSFNNVEKAFLAAYNVGDTLIYESNLGKKDTVWIMDKNIGYRPWDLIANTGEYKTLIGTVYYGLNAPFFNSEPARKVLLDISRSNPDTTSFFIHMKDAMVFIIAHDLDKYKVTDSTYLFYQTGFYRKRKYANYLYWNMRYGIVKFMGSDSVVWHRININSDPKDILSLPDIKDEIQLKKIRAKYRP